MDPVIIDLTSRALLVLLPFVTKSAEEFSNKVGDAAYEKAKQLFTLLRQSWSGDKEASENLERFEQKPERYKDVLKSILQEKLADDKELSTTVTRLLQEMGPTIKIKQHLEELVNSTAVNIDKMKSGNIDVDQEAKNISGSTLVNFKEIGG